jgi:hypothetical protein
MLAFGSIKRESWTVIVLRGYELHATLPQLDTDRAGTRPSIVKIQSRESTQARGHARPFLTAFETNPRTTTLSKRNHAAKGESV